MDLKNFIDNEWHDAKEALIYSNPATQEVLGRLPNSSREDLERGFKAAEKAFPSWSELPLEERASYLLKISSLIEKRKEEFAKAESLNTGKPLRIATNLDISRAIANFQFFAHALTQSSSEFYSTDTRGFNYVLRNPLGVVGTISPWNLPVYLLSWKIAPAIAAGNTVIAKPSELTPLTAHLLSEVIVESKLPKGVINILHGEGSKIGSFMTEHPKIKAISFTGGTATGKKVMASSIETFKKIQLELGGKNPTIIFADCDYEKTLPAIVRSSFSNQGQICLCGSRIFIEQKIYDRFKKDFCEQVSKLKIGNPLDFSTDVGAVISEGHFKKILSYIDLAKKEGGKVLLGGKASSSKGFFIEPTIIEGLSNESRVNQEEIFGPVVTLIPFSSEEEVLSLANDTTYGLSASVFTESVSRTHRMAKKLEAGTIWINTWLLRDLRVPFGGMKQSGYGNKDGGFEALKFYTETKTVSVSYETR